TVIIVVLHRCRFANPATGLHHREWPLQNLEILRRIAKVFASDAAVPQPLPAITDSLGVPDHRLPRLLRARPLTPYHRAALVRCYDSRAMKTLAVRLATRDYDSVHPLALRDVVPDGIDLT